MWDDETMEQIQSKLINTINMRYGNAIEKILRKDKNYRHLFQGIFTENKHNHQEIHLSMIHFRISNFD